MNRVTLVVAALMLLLFGSTQATAGTLTLFATAQGWMTAGTNNGTSPTNNYIAGNCGAGDCNLGEYRNFFEFSVPTIAGTIVSASLVLNTADALLDQSPSLSYQVTSLPVGFSFNTLGNGTVYGTRTYTAADSTLTESIALDAAALNDILAAAGGTFGVSGRVTSATSFGAGFADQAVFGGSSGAQELVITTTDVQGTPEPASAVLLGSALLGLAAWRARKRWNSAA